MSWDAVGAVAELVGSFAVVLTLIYLAVQMRQNSTIAVAESEREILASWDDAVQNIIQNNSTMLPAMRDLASLDEDEIHIAIARMAKLIQAHHMIWRMTKLNQISMDTVTATDRVIGMLLSTPGGRAYWEESRFSWPHAEHVDSILEVFSGPSWIEFNETFIKKLRSDA